MRKFAHMALLVLGGGMFAAASMWPVGAQETDLQINTASVQHGGFPTMTGLSAGNFEGSYTGASGDLVLSGLNAAGALAAARDIHCRGCQVRGNVSAGRDIRLEASPQVGSLAAGHDVTLLDTRVDGSVSAGHGVILSKSRVQGNLSTGNMAELQESEVQGSLSLGGERLKLDASTVAEDVYFQGSHAGDKATNPIAWHSGGSFIRQQNGSAFVRVGTNSISRVNGFTVQGSASQTTVITPAQAIYVNGRKVSGEGLKTYAEARRKNPAMPLVEGPGWPSELNTSMAKVESGSSKNSPVRQPVVNWLELSHHSQINGQVVFESGYGTVLLHPGCRVNGKIVNGTVEHLPD